MKLAIVVLAAGQGKRINSRYPKVLHPVAGRAMLKWVIEAATSLEPACLAVVVGYEAEQVRVALGDGYLYIEQREQKGTGHAIRQARAALQGMGDTVIALYGDTPLITGEALRRLLTHHATTQPAITLLTCHLDNPYGYGRIIRRDDGTVQAIVEEAAANDEQKAIREINPGFYCFREDWLWPHLEQIPLNPKGEYYLTDLVEIAVAGGERVEAIVTEDASEVLGVNDRVQLAEAEAVMRHRILRRLMRSGVTVVDPPSTFVDGTVTIGPDTVIQPHTFLQGVTCVGADCTIGPYAIIRDSVIGDRCQIVASMIENSTMEDGSDIGPFSHLRPGAHLGKGVHIGNFAEVKNSSLGDRTKMGHFSYLGDATVGEDVNIGGGAITCNFDGQAKHRTIIEDGAFIGSDTMLIAPVRVGSRAKTGAGSVVTREIPPKTLAYGVPASPKKKLEE